MRQTSSRGRARGGGAAAGRADIIAGRGRGRGRPVPAARTNDIPSSGSHTRQILNRYLTGPNATVRVVRPEQAQAVVDYVADGVSSSSTLSSTRAPDETALLSPAALENLSSTSSPCITTQPLEPQPMPESLMLFDDSAGTGCLGQPYSPAPVEEELQYPDAQPGLMFEDVDMGGSVQHVSSDDETQVPTAAALSNMDTDNEGRGEEECVEDNVEDDEVLDPTWNRGHASEVSSSEEEVEEVAQSPQHSKRGSMVQRPTGRPLAGTPATAHRTQGPPTPKSAGRSSLAWHFFRQCPEDKTRVFCTLCNDSLKRGRNVLSLSTTCMTRHLHAKHELQWSKHLKNPESSLAPPAPSSAAGSASSHTSGVTVAPGTPQTHDVVATPPPRSPSISTMSHGSVQLSISQTMERKRKYPPTHQRSQALNASISRLLAFEMLSFRLVETASFKNLMAVAVPQYVVPSRHYFSRRAIPTLHDQVVDKIRCGLCNAICAKVHITTDTWTSKHGQGRYISLTAHWVNVVAAGTETDSSLTHVLPPPRIAGRLSLPPVSSSSYSAATSSATSSSATSSSSQRSTSLTTTDFSTARAKRQQAVLKLLCLGPKPHTARELWTAIEQQTDEWFAAMSLKPGQVVCDNGRNLVAAVGLGGLTHIPCMAHVLNLVVQRFLRNYPNMSELLQKVRAVCARFRRSHPDAARLSALQRNFGLPAHRLICDVPTRWNSTLHMLDRLCEQQQAIVEFQLQHARVSRSAQQQHHFTTNEWATMRDLCAVLRCFEYATNMASANDAILSITIPLLCLLEKTLRAMMVEDVAQEEEEIFPHLSGQSITIGSEGGVLHHHRPDSQFSSQGTVLEEEEQEDEDEEQEDEEEPCSQQGGTQSSSRGPSVQRGWGDTEDTEDTPPTEDSLSLHVGTVAHMSEYMLQCLRNDQRVARIVTCADYWVATLLDPRYKDNVPSLIPSLERDRKMREYKHSLVEALLVAFPADTGASAEARNAHGRGSRRQHRWDTASTSEGRVSMAEMWKNFVSVPQQRAPPADTEHLSRRHHFSNMVTEYVGTRVHILSDGSAPFNFWVFKLGTWPELALYALEVLACPAASALSERVFSTAGGLITDRRIRLSTANVDKLTFLKMNQAWIPQDLLSLPCAE